jgi:hypothetical protein
MTQEELTERARYWQKRLRLQDWNLIVEWARKKDMKTEGNGEIWLNRSRMRGLISVLATDEQEPSSYGFGKENPEQTLIHELCHIFWNPFDTQNNTPLGDAEEQAVERLSTAFVEMEEEIRALRAEVAALKGGADG